MNNEIIDNLKFCPHCKQTKSLNEFSKSASYCKPCKNEWARNRLKKFRLLNPLKPFDLEVNPEENKRCTGCHLVKLLIEFNWVNKNINKLHTQCKDCTNEKSRIWNTNYIEKPEKKCRECKQIKPIEQFNRIYEYGRKHNICKDCKNKKSKAVEHGDWRLQLLDGARRRSEEFGLPFNLIIEDIIVPEFCPILGIKLHKGHGRTADCSPTLDRIIPKLGYIKENVMVISHKANTLKRHGDLNELEKIVNYIKLNYPIFEDYSI